MRLSAPTQPVFLIAVILGIIGTVGTFVSLPIVAGYTTYMVIAGFVLLALGSMVKGL
jgi:hypothetical protein